LEREFLLRAFGSGWQGLEQGEPCGEMMGRFRIGIPAYGSVCRLSQIADRPSGVSSALKVHRQLGRDVACLDTIPCLQTCANAPVQVDTLCRW
jgi:hypothetical protein